MPLPVDVSEGTETLRVWACDSRGQHRLQKRSSYPLIHSREAEEAPGGFTYVRDNEDPQCSNNCPCTVDDWGDSFYDAEGRLQALRNPSAEEHAGSMVWECGSACSCNPTCRGRISQQGLSAVVKLAKTEKDIHQGAFVCQYAGELLSRTEAARRLELYDAQDGPGHALLVVREVLPSQNSSLRINIDATRMGNVAHFFNHSCDGGNLVPVMVRTRGDLLPHVAMYASQDIECNAELTFRYGAPNSGPIEGHGERRSDQHKPRRCLCRTPQCQGFLPADLV